MVLAHSGPEHFDCREFSGGAGITCSSGIVGIASNSGYVCITGNW